MPQEGIAMQGNRKHYEKESRLGNEDNRGQMYKRKK